MSIMNIDDAYGNLRAHWDAAAANQPVYPTPQEALQLTMLRAAYNSLLNLGWQHIVCCPKDGTRFMCITPQGHFALCVYMGEWPKGGWFMEDADDLWPVYPALWKPMPSPEKELNP